MGGTSVGGHPHRRTPASEDTRIEAFASGLDEEFLKGTIRYTNIEGRVYEGPVVLLVTHFFNHQTHHRGQVHDMLSQTDVPSPVLDLHRVIKPNQIGKRSHVHRRAVQEKGSCHSRELLRNR